MSVHGQSSRCYLNRRQFLATGAAVPLLTGMTLSHVSAQETKAGPNSKWGVPGPYPGRVIEVRNPRMIKNDVKDRGAIHASLARGMKELTTALLTRSKHGEASSSRATWSA